MADSEEFGAEVARRREDAGLSQRQMGILTGPGLGVSRLRHIEAGYEIRGGIKIPFTPTRMSILKIARVLGWDPDTALAAGGHNQPATPSELKRAAGSDRETRERVRTMVGELHPHQLAAVAGVIQAMLMPHVPVVEITEVRTDRTEQLDDPSDEDEAQG